MMDHNFNIKLDSCTTQTHIFDEKKKKVHENMNIRWTCESPHSVSSQVELLGLLVLLCWQTCD